MDEAGAWAMAQDWVAVRRVCAIDHREGGVRVADTVEVDDTGRIGRMVACCARATGQAGSACSAAS
jgi:hypothetical protein